jgi:hypothetical protein
MLPVGSCPAIAVSTDVVMTIPLGHFTVVSLAEGVCKHYSFGLTPNPLALSIVGIGVRGIRVHTEINSPERSPGEFLARQIR